MRSALLRCAGLATVVLAGCQPAAAPTAGLAEADRDAIRQAADSAASRFNAAAASKDWTSYVNTYYADDAMVLPANGPTVSGRDAIIQFIGSFPPMSNVTFQLDEVEGQGDVAYVRGAYEMDIAVPGAPAPIHDKGKFVEIWKRQADGSWRITRDIFNSDMPAEAPADTTKKS